MHLDEYMQRRALKDEQVAQAIGRSRATVSRIRRRKSRPDWGTLEALREYSGNEISADDFVVSQ